jgi:competence protein ComEC
MRLRLWLSVVLLAAAIALDSSVVPARLGPLLEPNDRVSVGVNVRAEPRGDSTIRAVLRPGDRATRIGDVAGWYQVRLEGGTEGWASKGFLRVVAGTAPRPASGLDLAKLRVHFIDVGVGDAILIDYDDKEIFIDGGIGSDTAWTYVKNHIQGSIELVIVTHGDTDHWKGLTRIMGAEPAPKTPVFRAIEFWEPGYDRDCNGASSDPRKKYLDFMRAAKTKSQRFFRPLEAQYTPMVSQPSPSATAFIEIPELPGFKFQILHSDANPTGTTECSYLINDASIVFKLVVGEFSFLFTGDANGKERTGADSPGHVEAKLLGLEARLPGILKSTVLKAPHHGSETASTTAFLDKVKPEFVVISASTNHHLPRETVLARYNATGAVVLRTDKDRKSNNDHIVCFFTFEAAWEVNCNYADVL